MESHIMDDFGKISNVIPDAIIDLKYLGVDNFVGKQVYDQVYDVLRRKTLSKLIVAADELRNKKYRLVIWDAYRPLKVQKLFWDLVGDSDFVAHPDRGSKHNRGCAVDVSLADMEGNLLEMPAEFDDFSDSARADRQDLSEDVDRRLKDLQDAMTKAGFEVYENEWWHFTDVEWQDYDLV